MKATRAIGAGSGRSIGHAGRVVRRLGRRAWAAVIAGALFAAVSLGRPPWGRFGDPVLAAVIGAIVGFFAEELSTRFGWRTGERRENTRHGDPHDDNRRPRMDEHP